MFADFVASFEDSRAAGKTFVRGNTINPETKGELSSFFLLDYLMEFKQQKWQLTWFVEAEVVEESVSDQFM